MLSVTRSSGQVSDDYHSGRKWQKKVHKLIHKADFKTVLGVADFAKSSQRATADLLKHRGKNATSEERDHLLDMLVIAPGTRQDKAWLARVLAVDGAVSAEKHRALCEASARACYQERGNDYSAWRGVAIQLCYAQYRQGAAVFGKSLGYLLALPQGPQQHAAWLFALSCYRNRALREEEDNEQSHASAFSAAFCADIFPVWLQQEPDVAAPVQKLSHALLSLSKDKSENAIVLGLLDWDEKTRQALLVLEKGDPKIYAERWHQSKDARLKVLFRLEEQFATCQKDLATTPVANKLNSFAGLASQLRDDFQGSAAYKRLWHSFEHHFDHWLAIVRLRTKEAHLRDEEAALATILRFVEQEKITSSTALQMSQDMKRRPLHKSRPSLISPSRYNATIPSQPSPVPYPPNPPNKPPRPPEPQGSLPRPPSPQGGQSRDAHAQRALSSQIVPVFSQKVAAQKCIDAIARADFAAAHDYFQQVEEKSQQLKERLVAQLQSAYPIAQLCEEMETWWGLGEIDNLRNVQPLLRDLKAALKTATPRLPVALLRFACWEPHWDRLEPGCDLLALLAAQKPEKSKAQRDIENFLSMEGPIVPFTLLATQRDVVTFSPDQDRWLSRGESLCEEVIKHLQDPQYQQREEQDIEISGARGGIIRLRAPLDKSVRTVLRDLGDKIRAAAQARSPMVALQAWNASTEQPEARQPRYPAVATI